MILRQNHVKTICQSGILGYGISIRKMELVLTTQDIPSGMLGSGINIPTFKLILKQS